MKLTIDARAALAYVEGAGLPDTSAHACEALDRAIHELAHGGPVTMATLARRMGIPEGTLNHKVNPNNHHHFLRPSQLLELQQAAGAVGPLRVMAAELGYGLFRTGPSLFDGDPLRVLAQAVRACADLHVQATHAYVDAERDPAGMSRNAMRRVEAAAEDAQEAIGHVLQAMRSMMRTAPKVD